MYVLRMGESKMDGAAPPFCSQIIAKLPFRYGTSPREECDSLVYCHMNSSASKSARDSSSQPASLGFVVRGMVGRSHSDYDAAQLKLRRGAPLL